MLVGDGVKTALYAYDVFGGKTSEADPKGSTTASEYDALNRLVKTRYPEVKWHLTSATVSALTELSADNANGSVVEATDKRGVKTITACNYLNQPVEVLVAFRVNKKTMPTSVTRKAILSK